MSPSINSDFIYWNLTHEKAARSRGMLAYHIPGNNLYLTFFL